MIEFLNFVMQGTIPHRDTRLPFNKGVNIVRGANFSGKSSMFLLMGQLVTGELPNTPKREKDNVGRLSLSFLRDGRYCETAYDLKKNRVASIIEDGQEVSYRSVADYQAKLDQMLPFTLDSWQNSAYISGHTFPYLLYGTSQHRKQLFESLFDIDTDRQYKFFRKLDSHMEKIETERNTLRDLDVERVYTSDLRSLESRIDKLRSQLDEAEARLKVAGKYLETKEAWGRYTDKFSKKFGKLSKDQLKARLQEIDPATLHDELERARSYEHLLAMDERHKNAREGLANATKAYAQFKNGKMPLTMLQITSLLNIYSEYDALFEAHPSEPDRPDLDALENELDKLQRRIKALEHASTCPLCNTELFGQDKTKLLMRLRRERDAAQHSVDDAAALENELDDIEAVIAVLRGIKIDWPEAQKWRKQKKQLLAFIKLSEAIDIAEECPAVVLPKKAPRSIDDIENDIRSCKQEMNAIDAYLAFSAACLDACFNGADESLEQDARELRDKLRTLEDVYSEKKVEHRKFLDVQRKISRCNFELKIQPAVKKLKELYSPKGLRAARVRDKVEQYIENLNEEARGVFPNYRFFIETDDDSGVNIKCERPTGISPIRRFSGAEGAIFPLLSLLALNPLLPDEKRTNLLILDEPEKGMRSDTRKLFVNEIVPRLAQAYPSLWIVTPMEAEDYPIHVPDCKTHEYETYAENGVSTLVEL
jgi:DNA repair exonuclease SbcCD ATPase subunit